ncbi:MAG: polyphosphate kinase 1 [Deltaproteobacteria bacterium]|nr:polyphosphate kinase 1 [Deltaproteobacteria bacterium]
MPRKASTRLQGKGAPALDAPQSFINRELSWLAFNARVLHEGLNPENPPLERLAFLAIVASNLDEFFMVRVGGLKQLLQQGDQRACPAGLTPGEQLEQIARRAHSMVGQLYQCLQQDLLPQLARRGIVRMRPETLERKEEALATRYFSDELFPSLTPLAVSDDDDLAEAITGLTLHFAVRLRREDVRASDPERQMALLPLPRSLARFLPLPSEAGHRFLLVEDVVRRHLERFFPGYEVEEAALFRLTRNADLSLDEEEATDLLEAMEDVLRARRGGAPVRLELAADASKQMAAWLRDRLGLADDDLYRLLGPIDLKPFLKLAGRLDGKGLRYPAFEPQPVAAFDGAESPWAPIRERDVLVHLPYESFRPVLDLLEAAADDPQVLAIKQTLYRTSVDSPIIAALERAARSGKQVTVLVELKARFDEAQNIAWSRRLTEAGAQVVYGVVGLKTHAKLMLIVRREPDGTRRYVHVSTGNYNDATAGRYEDVGMFTCDPEFGADASNFFNAVTGYSEPREWRQLVVAPTGLRERLRQLIDREIARTSKEDPGLIMLKMNSLADRAMAEHLFRAAQAGVRVKLCVRGICCLRPGVRGVSTGIEVVSIVDRFLEHSRLFYFKNGGEEEVYGASADFMPRNLDRRLEIMFPVRDEVARRRLVSLLTTCFEDNQRAWRLRPDGLYERVTPRRGQPPRRAQETFMEEAIARAEAARVRRLSVFRPLGPGMAPGLRR